MTTEHLTTLLRGSNDNDDIAAIREEIETYAKDGLAYVESTNPDAGRIAVTDEDGNHMTVEVALEHIDRYLAAA